MKTCYIYLRVSSEDQVKGFSIDNQERVCADYAKLNGFEVKEVFTEEGKSARTSNRPELQRMFKAIKIDPPTAVICMKIDRMFRNIGDFSRIRKEFKKADISLLSVNEGDITDGLIGNIFASVAEWESEVNGKRTKGGMHQKFRSGYYPGKAPLGYRNATRNDLKIIEPDPLTAPLIKEMFRMYAGGQYSQLELCMLMHEKGLRGNKSNEMLTPQTLTGIFHNPIYFGWMKWGGLEGQGKHEALIDKSLFDQVQHVLAQNNFFLIRKRKRFFVLRGFAYCPIHERRLTADWNKLSKPTKSGRVSICYYRCTHRGGCKPSYVETGKLEKMIANQFKKYEFSPEFVELVREHARTHLEGGRADLRSRKQALVNEKRGIEEKRNNLEDRLVDNTIDRDIFKRQHKNLQDLLTNIEKQLHELNNAQPVDFKVIDEVLAMTRNLYQSYCDAPDFLKRHYLRLFFDRIYIKDKKIVKLVETPIFKVLREENKLVESLRLTDQWGG